MTFLNVVKYGINKIEQKQQYKKEETYGWDQAIDQ